MLHLIMKHYVLMVIRLVKVLGRHIYSRINYIFPIRRLKGIF